MRITQYPRRRSSLGEFFEFALVGVLVAGFLNVRLASARDPGDLTPPYSPLPDGPCRPPEYPVQSQRAGEHGAVLLSMIVAADGVVNSVTVERSSGFRQLDVAAVDAMRLCRFIPKLVDGVPVEAKGFFTSVFGEVPIPLGASESLVAPLRLQRYIEVMTERCRTHFPDMAATLDAARAAWHLDNDALAQKIDDYRNNWDARLKAYARNLPGSDTTQAAPAASLDEAVQSASLAVASFEEQTPTEQSSYCQRYAERLSGRLLDLSDVVIRFPELEAAVAPLSDEIRSP